METRAFENPTIEEIEAATTLMFEKNMILYKKVVIDELVVLYFKFDED